jgi:tripartite-type tricarboxylate transporter receptor subunit TctC
LSLWFGMWAPTGTPPAVVQKLNAEVAKTMKIAEVRQQFDKLGISPTTMTPDEFAQFVRREIGTYKRIVTKAGINPI